jgi:hypothetical protein
LVSKLGSSEFVNPEVSGYNYNITASFFYPATYALEPYLWWAVVPVLLCCLLVVLRKFGSVAELFPTSLCEIV